MPTKKLNAASLATLPPGDWADLLMPGLIFRVGSRRRAWNYRCRVGAKKLRVPLGHFPLMGLAEARAACGRAAQRIDSVALWIAWADRLATLAVSNRLPMMRRLSS